MATSPPPVHGMMPHQDEHSFAQEQVRRSRFCGFRDSFDYVDCYITTSRFGHFFRLSGSGHVRIVPLSLDIIS